MKKLSRIALLWLPAFLGLTLVMPQVAGAVSANQQAAVAEAVSPAQQAAYDNIYKEEAKIEALQKQLESLRETKIKMDTAYAAWDVALIKLQSAEKNLGVAKQDLSKTKTARDAYDIAKTNWEAAQETYYKTKPANFYYDRSRVRSQLATAEQERLKLIAVSKKIEDEHPRVFQKL